MARPLATREFSGTARATSSAKPSTPCRRSSIAWTSGPLGTHGPSRKFDDQLLVLRDVGNKHMLVVGGRRPGCYCVGIVAFNPWADIVVIIVQGMRSIALTLRTKNTMGYTENLQIASANFPSGVHRTPSEIAPAPSS